LDLLRESKLATWISKKSIKPPIIKDGLDLLRRSKLATWISKKSIKPPIIKDGLDLLRRSKLATWISKSKRPSSPMGSKHGKGGPRRPPFLFVTSG